MLVKSQDQLDQICKSGERVEVNEGFFKVREGAHVVAMGSAHVVAMGSAHVVAMGSAHVEAWGSAHVEAWGSAHVVAMGSSHVEAWGSAHVEAWGSAHVVAMGSAYVAAWGSAHVVAWESARVEAWESAHVEAWGSAHVVAWGSTHVVAMQSSHVVAWESSHVEAWGKSTCTRRSKYSKCDGNVYEIAYPSTVKEWLKHYKVPIRKGKVILYKATGEEFDTQHNTRYLPGTETVALDWEDTTTIECGKALHFCAKPYLCDQFRHNPAHYVACQVDISDIRIYNGGEPDYPDKIRGRACVNLYEVDRQGKRIASKRHLESNKIISSSQAGFPLFPAL